MPHTEIITEIPLEVRERCRDGLTPVFLAYECVLLEKFTGLVYVYKAAHLESGEMSHLCQMPARLTASCYEAMAAQIRVCEVAGTGRMEADTCLGKRVGSDKLAYILEVVFRELLPMQGYGVREQQVELAVHIMECLCRRNISLSEAEVGAGKTHAYLIAAALAKRGRYNDLWIKSIYPGIAYITSMPVVVSTSSIALQNAIVSDYIPEISRILLDHGIINTPLTCVLRKGREHYLCEKRLRTYLRYESTPETIVLLTPLLDKRAGINLGQIVGITPYIKRRINVTGHCDRNCPQRKKCRYLRFLNDAQSDSYDFQVCNHQYLLADVRRRKDGQSPLIPHYEAVIIDEAHKLLAAARQIYGFELDSAAIPQIVGNIRDFTFRQGESDAAIRDLSALLLEQNYRLFERLAANIPISDPDEEIERFPALIDADADRHLRCIGYISGELAEELSKRAVLIRYIGQCAQVLRHLENIRTIVSLFECHDNLVSWIKNPGEGISLHAIPKNLSEQLHRDFWRKGIPVVLTSGTLSAAGNFGSVD